MAKQITEMKTVIKELGGAETLAEIFGISRQAVSNWAWRKKASPDTYVAMQKMLEKKGLRAPASLWAMKGLD